MFLICFKVDRNPREKVPPKQWHSTLQCDDAWGSTVRAEAKTAKIQPTKWTEKKQTTAAQAMLHYSISETGTWTGEPVARCRTAVDMRRGFRLGCGRRLAWLQGSKPAISESRTWSVASLPAVWQKFKKSKGISVIMQLVIVYWRTSRGFSFRPPTNVLMTRLVDEKMGCDLWGQGWVIWERRGLSCLLHLVGF